MAAINWTRQDWVGAGVALVLVTVVAFALLWSAPAVHSSRSVSPPPVNVTLVPNGTRLNLSAGGFGAVGPVVVPSNFSGWTITSAVWWQSNGTTDCLMTVGFFDHWNKSQAPSNCDGVTYYGSPNSSGSCGYPDFDIRPGLYYAVWYNLSPNEVTRVFLEQALVVTAVG